MRWSYREFAAAAATAIVLILSAGGASAQDVNVTGTWVAQVVTDQGEGAPVLTLEQVGDSISGSYSSELFGQAPVRGRVSGNQVTMNVNVDAQGTPVTVTFQGTVESAELIRGSYDLAGMLTGTFTARPRPEPATPG